MKTKIFLIAFAIILGSCSSTKKLKNSHVIGSWKLTEVLDQDAQAAGAKSSQKLVLNFYPDFTFSKIHNKNVTHGQWVLNGENVIEFGGNKLVIDSPGDIKEKGYLEASMFDVDENSTSDLVFRPFPIITKYEEDAFHVSNNLWRKKATKKETNKEISDRLSNYLMHNAYLLKTANEGSSLQVSFAASKGIIRMFDGGVGIVKEEKIADSWKNAFYDKEDAMKAFYLLQSFLDKQGVYRNGETGHWVTDNYNSLLALVSKINNVNKENNVSLFRDTTKKARQYLATL